ncbi:MAG: hypothetical protein JWP12_2698 [Bacteroidetes bacterium]|nr:hypothetical protein [Bacteroidota bacterium]
MEEYTQSAFYYIKLLMRWKIQFIVITVLAIAASAIFSSEMFIKPRYKSSATVYPANVVPFSEESTTEQILQIFQSNTIRTAVMNKFDLAKHYGIDTTKKEGHAALIGVYQTFVSISKTQYESVDIEVTDTDPEMARNMVNEIIFQLNDKVSTLHKTKSLEVGIVLQKQMALKRAQLDSLGDSLQVLRSKYHILDYNIQVEEVTKGYMKALNSGKGLKDIDELMRNLEEKGGDYYRLKVAYDAVLLGYNQVSNDYDNVQKELNKRFTYTYIVSYPSVSDKKAYPVRWLIVLISTVSANVFLFLVIIIGDYRKRMVI